MFRAQNLKRAIDNFRCPKCLRGFVVVPWRLELGEDNLEIVDSFCYLGECDFMWRRGRISSKG